jgi:hypothetical protein
MKRAKSIIKGRIRHRKTWHIGKLTGLGWLEIGIKLTAHIVAFAALAWTLFGTQYGTVLRFWGGIYDAQVVILGLLALRLTFVVADRYVEKEIIITAFGVVNVVAHCIMIYALWRQPGYGGLLHVINFQPQDMFPWQVLPIFCGLMLIGDLVKIIFLLRTKSTVRGYKSRFLIYLTSVVMAMEGILLLLSLSNT